MHLDGSLADLSMIKPELNSSVKDEEIGEKVDIDEDDIKIRREEDEEICSVYCKSASFSCHIIPEPEPDQANGNFHTSQSIHYCFYILYLILRLNIFY